MIDIATPLSAAYTKALLHNPKAKVYENIKQALDECPLIARSVNNHDALVECLRDALGAVDMCKGQGGIDGWTALANKIESTLAAAKGAT